MNDSNELASQRTEITAPQDQPVPVTASQSTSAEKAAKHTRRVFLFQLSLGLNAVVGAVLAVPILGYVLGPMFKKNGSYNSWVPLTMLDAMPVGATRLVEYLNPQRTPTDGDTDKVACWARRLSPTSYEVFAINCAHLGCPVRWFEQSQLFLCPCHGGAYYANGDRASGPPERGLFKYDVRVSAGRVYINAGEMPTLATQACREKKNEPLIHIQTDSAEQAASEAYNHIPISIASEPDGRNA
ncbi:QcrA and Rieske domain-containing protein [Granulicella tundricola]|uniref:Rieske (2Fe-2S) iron-sulfur domain protein n=1 Tax=Granulicella tundricola (strain ATCC BAA-1859 / DSM 23138 / MP5ACTX9) TaxID=1198114 RepID=E8X2H9_GRATM|nr:Rieske 2Fe-2S domain-containing protein [Granulicella tundricola]ADW69203.1 Rieske (2Fe-2S) iron-sulfur domain protein [Granulicella tundricola MP5ACTX9]